MLTHLFRRPTTKSTVHQLIHVSYVTAADSAYSLGYRLMPSNASIIRKKRYGPCINLHGVIHLPRRSGRPKKVPRLPCTPHMQKYERPCVALATITYHSGGQDALGYPDSCMEVAAAGILQEKSGYVRSITGPSCVKDDM